MLSEAARRPIAEGRNATCTVQLAPTAIVDPQRLVTRKSPVLAPLSVMLLRLRVWLPVLVRVTFKLREVLFSSWVEKLRLEGEIEMFMAGVPVPVRVTYCVPPELLIVREPVRRPVCEGVKKTLKEQRVFPGFSTYPTHPPSVWKSPLAALLIIVMAVLPGW